MEMEHKSFVRKEVKPEVLIVDDQEINRDILEAIIEDEFTPLLCADGAQALETIAARRDTVSLVLLDLHMPGLSGQDVLRTLKDDPDLRKIPVIVMTGEQDAEVECLELGASDFISKSTPNSKVILARIRRTVELYQDRQIIEDTERDPVTGLYTREYFFRYAEQFDMLHKELDMDAALVDVNHFHMINERFGKAYGDEILRQIGAGLGGVAQEAEGLACRRGSDTFLLYIPHGTGNWKLVERVSASLMGDSAGTRVRLRMGIYESVDKSVDMERRFDRAKIAADTVRNNFTRNVASYDAEMHRKALYHDQLIENFPRAISERQFKVYYQPKFDVTPEIPVLAGAEALVRWQHPTLGLISPGVFIPLFEENGLIQTLDHYVWRTAAAQIKKWRKRFNFTVPVSVNASRIDMYDPDLVPTLLSILEENGLAPSDLRLEITESAYTQDSRQIIESVSRLRELGFKIEMDDFGTGYSSLNMISSLPIDALKLDMLFIRGAFSKGKDTRMLEFIIDIADYLSVPVIAEGVESAEQLSALRAMGCDYVQGYYFSKPVPADEYERFIEDRAAQEPVPQRQSAPAQQCRGGADLSYAKISYALSCGFESVYYVDVDTGDYVVFNEESRREDLQMQRAGSDFFADVEANVPKLVFGPDRERVLLNLRREALLSQLVGSQPFSMTYRLVVAGNPVYYCLKVVRADQDGGHHIVCGVCRVDDHIRQPRPEEENVLNFSSLSKALARDMESIYYVDLETGTYAEFVASDGYRDLKLEISGTDFFGEVQRNIPKAVYAGDQERLARAIQRAPLEAALAEFPAFFIDYRVVSGGKLVHYRLKAAYAEPGNRRHVILGVSNVHGQISEIQRREAELARALRLAQEFAGRDALTGVKTRRVFAAAEEEWNRRMAEGAPAFAVVVCGVDGLKEVNGTLGRQAGDQLIKDVAAAVCTTFKHSPVYRTGGRKFATVLSGQDYEDRFVLMRTLQEKAEAQTRAGGVAVACGMAELSAGDECFGALFERAGKAMRDCRTMPKGIAVAPGGASS